MNWYCKTFENLTPHELYAIIRLRNEVFVVEQNCVFQDADNKDQVSYHFMGWENSQLAAYTRIMPAGSAYDEASIGRVVTSSSVRGNGIGKELMERSLEATYSIFGNVPVRIGAQLYLQVFYEGLGFIKSGDIYLEDGIEHIEMIKK